METPSIQDTRYFWLHFEHRLDLAPVPGQIAGHLKLCALAHLHLSRECRYANLGILLASEAVVC